MLVLKAERCFRVNTRPEVSRLWELLFKIAAVSCSTPQLCSRHCKAALLSQRRRGEETFLSFSFKTPSVHLLKCNCQNQAEIPLPTCSPGHRGEGCGSVQQADFFIVERGSETGRRRGKNKAMNKLRVKSENKNVQAGQCADYRSSMGICCWSGHPWGGVEKDEVQRVIKPASSWEEAV